ncbi:MAG TPA: hypothetical protein PK098_00955 [Phycisphaerales bacterium]|nr:hypothetical protein [Phycisphaerales bacterium]
MRFDVMSRRCRVLAFAAGSSMIVCGAAAADGLVETFSINVGDTVSNGVPEPGAGNLERIGSSDVYTFSVDRPTLVYFDEISGSCSILWRCVAPDETVLFTNNNTCISDPGSFFLDQEGDYTITVYSTAGVTGTYSFKLWEVLPPDEFVIGLNETVSSGVPGPGAGNIEQPGSVDVYTLFIDAGTVVYFDEIAGGCSIQWRCKAPDATIVFSDAAMCITDPGIVVVNQTGHYTIEAFGSQSTVGTYSFRVWSVPPPDEFEIELDQIVSNGIPEPGAGNIEQPGSRDIYTLNITSPVRVYFDELGGPCNIQWRCEAPDGSVLFNNNAMCITDPGEFLLDQIGEYVISVYGTQSAVGTYSFVLVSVEQVEVFEIELEQVVSNGVPGPGAGNIEEPGAVDEYILAITKPTLVYFDELSGSCSIQWRCEAPDGFVLFSNDAMCITDPGLFLLDQMGEYTIRVYGNQSATGTYSFTIWDVGPPDEFEIEIDEVVSEGVPGEGAGFIEKPGSSDIYSLVAEAGTEVCFESMAGSCTLRWSAEAPDGSMLFEDAMWCSANPGRFTLVEAGEYLITVRAVGDFVGAYSFVVNTARAADFNGDCRVDVLDLLILLGAWGTCPARGDCPADINGSGGVDVQDLLILLGNWG